MKNLENKLFNENENGARYYNATENAYFITYLDAIYSNEFEVYLKERYIVTPYQYGIKVTK